jgi:hypothetical protein
MICLKTLLIDKLWIYWAYKLYLFCETKLTKKYFKIDKFKNQLKNNVGIIFLKYLFAWAS